MVFIFPIFLNHSLLRIFVDLRVLDTIVPQFSEAEATPTPEEEKEYLDHAPPQSFFDQKLDRPHKIVEVYESPEIIDRRSLFYFQCLSFIFLI